MLVLNRKPGERIMIGQDIEVAVVGVQRGRVKLGFTAPAHVPILRAELQRRDQERLPGPTESIVSQHDFAADR